MEFQHEEWHESAPRRQWSEQQQRVFAWFAAPRGNLIVRARAGTGKTTTIVEALKYIGAQSGAPAPRILLCAFNKAIQEALAARVGSDPRTDVKTLHAVGFMFLKSAWGLLNVDGDVDTERVKAAFGGDTKVPWDAVTAAKRLVSVAKSALPFGTVDEIADLAVAHGIEVESHLGIDAKMLARAARGAMIAALECDPACRISFDDMLFVPVVKELTLPLYDWVIVDEAQDMAPTQLTLAMRAVRPGGHIVVVGDDRQAIYGFRGADSNALDRMREALCAEELNLTTTFRCAKSIVAAAQRLVPDLEAPAWAQEGIVDTVSTSEVMDDAAAGDAILSRVNAPLVPLCLGLIRRGTPARIEGRDIGKLMADRVKKLKAGDIEELLKKIARWRRNAEGRAIAHGRGVEQRLAEIADVEETIVALADSCETVAQVLARCETMFGETAAAEQVVLSSVHKAKGREWERVFVLQETFYCYGKRPLEREEANIEYVAMTRAKRALLVIHG